MTRSFFKPLDTDGFLVLRLIATRRRLWQFTECGSFSRPSIGARHDDFYLQKGTSASGLRNKMSPSILPFKPVACVCHQPDNSRSPARIAAKRRQHFHRIWPIPSDISPSEKVAT
ncbi:hypothetical protein PFLUV_G00031830 [Perca fluviatilis]|uniref:Uncharacterized protein n=1 Tax=Perca fluviatilis TaxID=8168 RepID=A0A6A5FQI8_PERFL|nr:hypothetical protein PFLUV_G00031830 [Perca fluviatilis]